MEKKFCWSDGVILVISSLTRWLVSFSSYVRDTIRSHHNFCTVFGDELYAATKPMTWDGHRFYVHIYYEYMGI